MSHLIITEAQANQIRGNHGKYSAIDPIKVPDGTYVIPEACLSDVDLAEINNILTTMATNVQDIIDLPEVGVECVKDMLYKYNGGTDNKATGLVKCVQTHNRTIYPPEETPALFSFFRENSDTLEWIPNEWVELGWKRMYNDQQYEVIQSHQTLSSWTPDVTPALWKLVEQSEEIPVWVQPTGAHDAYRLGAKVHFPTMADPIYESLIDYNTYSPAAYPAGWKKL